jgi:F-type H+-transporting ATPase subunit epsilon
MSFNLQIISPEKTLFDESVEMVIIPGTEGDLGVLSNHMPLITSLRLGNIYVYKDNKVIKKFLVNGGILEVIENRCTLLTEDISDLEGEVVNKDDNNDQLAQKKREIASQQFYS